MTDFDKFRAQISVKIVLTFRGYIREIMLMEYDMFTARENSRMYRKNDVTIWEKFPQNLATFERYN